MPQVHKPFHNIIMPLALTVPTIIYATFSLTCHKIPAIFFFFVFFVFSFNFLTLAQLPSFVFRLCSSFQFPFLLFLLFLELSSNFFVVVTLEFLYSLRVLHIFFFQRSGVEYFVVVDYVERPHYLLAKFTCDRLVVECVKGCRFYLLIC